MRCCVYTRSFNEDPYLYFFIEHYISLGFDKIIILKADNNKINLGNYYNYVEIYYVENLENRLLPIHTNKVVKYDWVLSIDIDEILLINNNNIKEYINERLEIDKNINIFYFRWGILEKYDNSNINNLINLTKQYNIYENDHIKTMAKGNLIKSIWHPHLMELNVKPYIFFENKILETNKPNNHPISIVSYKKSILIHLHTRSLNNLVIKAFTTRLGFHGRNTIQKKIKNIHNFIKLINEPSNYELLQNFRKVIGFKADKPFVHSKANKIKYFDFKINHYENDLIENQKEEELIEKIFIENNINIKEYYKKCNEIGTNTQNNFKKNQDN
jgi:hypothetical protein